MSFWHSACSTSSPDARTARKEESEEPDISALLRMLGSVSDPRGSRGRQYPLEYVLAVCVVAMLAGAKSYAEIARHAADMPQPLLKKLGAKWDWFKLRYAWPGMSVIWNVLTRVDAAELDRITGTWIAARARKDRKGEWILALDGKVMRGAWTSENDKVTMFSALLLGCATAYADRPVMRDICGVDAARISHQQRICKSQGRPCDVKQLRSKGREPPGKATFGVASPGGRCA